MTRYINALLVFLMVLSAAAVYDLKYEAETAAERVQTLERQIAREQEAISLLKAEWSLLNQPGRLNALVEHHADILKLQPLTSTQIGTIADIPAKPVVIDSAKPGKDGTGKPVEQRAAGAADDIATGSIR